jgi:hypothetical protein
MIEHEDTANALQAKVPNPRRIHFNAGTRKDSSGAMFQSSLRTWFYTKQARFPKQADFAAAIGVSPETLQGWFGGKSFPAEPFCDKLYDETQLDCFSPTGRVAARREHEKKKGLSRAAIQKRDEREYLKPEELARCVADPELAFTIRGDERIACLECGQLLKHIREFHLRAHNMTAANYRIGTNPENPRYGPKRGLVCNARAAGMRAEIVKRKFQPGSAEFLASVRPPQKGKKMPPEFSRKTSVRMRGQRKPEWGNDVSDVEVMWEWLIDGKLLEEVNGFSQGGVWVRLKTIIGKPVRRGLTIDDLPNAPAAMEVVHRSAGDEAKLRNEFDKLCKESRNQVARSVARAARSVLLWIPRALAWRKRNLIRAEEMTGADLGRAFAAEELRKLKSPRPLREKHGRESGRKRRPERETVSKPKRGIGKKTGDMLVLYAAFEKKKTSVYGMATTLYPGRDQESAEAATRLLRKRHRGDIDRLRNSMTEAEAERRIAQATPNKSLKQTA